MRSAFAMAATFLLLALSPGTANSTIVPGLDLDQLVRDSSIIAVGEVTSLQKEGKAPIHLDSLDVTGETVGGVLRVNQVLKGEPYSTELRFAFLIPETFIGWRSPALHTSGVFFFKIRRGTSGELEFTSPYYPFAPAISAFPLKEETTTIDRVVSAIGKAIFSPKDTVGTKVTAVYFLSTSRSEASLKELHSALDNPDRELRVRAAGALLERNDISALPLAVDALLHGFPGASEEAIHNLVYAIAGGVSNEGSVPMVVELLKSPDPQIRRASAAALRRTGSEKAIRALSSLLGDSDLETRYYAVVGLAEITGQTEWRPNMEDFASDQQRYLDHWRDWARNR
jgi:hypothetical protein